MGAVEENSVGLLPDEMKEEMMRKATSSMNIRAVEEKENKTKSAAISTKMKAENGEGQRSVNLGSSDRICNDVAVKLKELILQPEEDRKNIIILQDSLDKLNEKIKMYKRQLEEQESISNSNILRVKKFQRELESPENRDEEAEPTSNQFRSRERVFASASARSEKSTDVQETEVVVKKTINKVNIGSPSVEEPPLLCPCLQGASVPAPLLVPSPTQERARWPERVPPTGGRARPGLYLWPGLAPQTTPATNWQSS